MLRIATPVADPLLRSSNFDCSQVRVPSPDAKRTITRIESKNEEELFTQEGLPMCYLIADLERKNSDYHGCGADTLVRRL